MSLVRVFTGTLKKLFISGFLSPSSVTMWSAPRFFSLSVSFWRSGLETKHNPGSSVTSAHFLHQRLPGPSATGVRTRSFSCGKLGPSHPASAHPASPGLSFLTAEECWVVATALLVPRTLETFSSAQGGVRSLPDFFYLKRQTPLPIPCLFKRPLQSVTTYPGPRVALCLFTKANRAILLVSTTEGMGNWSEYQFS